MDVLFAAHSGLRYLVLFAAVVALAVIGRAAEPVAVSGRAMGTTWSVKFIQPAVALTPAAVERHPARKVNRAETRERPPVVDVAHGEVGQAEDGRRQQK